MTTSKKPGRPPGTDHKEDILAMDLMADAIVAGSAKTPTDAARKTYAAAGCRGQCESAIVTRLVAKWKKNGEAALARATGRLQKFTPSGQMPHDIGAATTLRATATSVAPSWPDPDRRSNAQKLLFSTAATASMQDFARLFGGGGQSHSVHFLSAAQAARDALKAIETAGGISHLHRQADQARAAMRDAAASGLDVVKVARDAAFLMANEPAVAVPVGITDALRNPDRSRSAPYAGMAEEILKVTGEDIVGASSTDAHRLYVTTLRAIERKHGRHSPQATMFTF